MRIGYTLMTEQAGPKALVRYAAAAERAGFDFEVSSDHFSPWLEQQGHAPYVWSVLGAVAQCTERVELMTYVTCPIMRYHPAVVAQKASTMQLLSDGRFTLGLGAGENLDGGYFNYVGDPRFAPLADAMVAVEPKASLCQDWDKASGRTKARKIGQLPVSWDPARKAAAKRAHEQFRWFGGWKVNAELPGPSGFAEAELLPALRREFRN